MKIIFAPSPDVNSFAFLEIQFGRLGAFKRADGKPTKRLYGAIRTISCFNKY